MRVQLIYRCRFCRQDEVRDVSASETPRRERLGFYLLNLADQTVAHDCASSHVGLCDLVGVVVVEGEG